MNLEQEHQQQVIRYYETTQRFYEQFWHKGTFGLHYGFWVEGVVSREDAIIKENEVLADLAGVKQRDLVLDAGCGIGGSGFWLTKKREAQVVGLNIVHKQLIRGQELARKKGLFDKLAFTKGDYQRLPFKEKSFDVLWFLESIEHATNIEDLLKEAFRVLKPQGKIIIAATFKGKEELSDEERRQLTVGLNAAGTFTDFRTAKEVSKIMEEADFLDIQNLDKTEWVLESARQITRMCRWGLPAAEILSALRLVSPILVTNNQWGIYQEGLFRSGATSYNILLAKKPK